MNGLISRLHSDLDGDALGEILDGLRCLIECVELLMSRWWSRLSSAVPFIVAGGIAAGCQADLNESQLYQKEISIDGYSLVRKGYADGATGVYVGPTVTDPTIAIGGPGLVVSADGTDFSNGAFKWVASGIGHAEGLGECNVAIFVVESGPGTAEYAGLDNISDAQRRGLSDRSLQVVKVDVLCDAQADR